MAFVKLDTAILDSTVWIENVQRNMFITALLMAVPFEATEPMAQIEVRSLNKTGFVAPPGWYGFVHAAGVGIAGRAGIPQNLGLDALEIMGKEEPESRSPEFGGRRLIRVNGGYLVLNFQKYRDKDHTASVRAMRYRQRQKGKSSSVTPVTRNERDVTRNVTQAEAEAEASNTPLTPLKRGEVWCDEAKRVASACNITDDKILPVIHKALLAYAKENNVPESEVADGMVRRHREFVELGTRGFLRHTWSPAKFFGHGHWINEGMWPIDKAQVEKSHRR